MNQNRLGKRGGIKNFGQWRGGNNQSNRQQQQHNEHDDRKSGGSVTDIKRRVTFKNAGGRGGRGGGIRLSDVRIRAQLEADEEMSGDVEHAMKGGHNGGFKGRGGRGGMRGRRSGSPPPRMGMGFQVRTSSNKSQQLQLSPSFPYLGTQKAPSRHFWLVSSQNFARQ